MSKHGKSASGHGHGVNIIVGGGGHRENDGPSILWLLLIAAALVVGLVLGDRLHPTGCEAESSAVTYREDLASLDLRLVGTSDSAIYDPTGEGR